MLYDTHVYLGPSLDVAIAQTILPEAHYHPPIQCGDLLRLLRLNPQRVIIIDGYYEFTPAVWHKEILHAMEQGVEVWGAASMGALRAAELCLYGMKGVGQIFEDFASGKLNDDDEVAVLHASEKEGYRAVNDAMVNIRQTLLQAYQDNILANDAHEALLSHCKNLFYPYRSLSRVIDQLKAQFPQDCEALSAWLNVHGLVDQKQLDTITVLQQARQSGAVVTTKTAFKTPMTGYLKTLLHYVTATPIKHEADWLPDVEKQFQSIAKNEPIKHQLLAELAVFMRQLASYVSKDVRVINSDMVSNYIKENNLYSPEQDFAFLKQHDLSDLYLLITQLICETKLTPELIQRYLPAIAHYYDIPEALIGDQISLLLKRLLIIIMLMKTRYADLNAVVNNDYLSSHLSRISTLRQYDLEKAKQWIEPAHIDRYCFMSFLMMYAMSSGCVLSFNCSEQSNHRHYSKWIYPVINSL